MPNTVLQHVTKLDDTVPLKVPKMVGVQKLSMITNFRKGLNNKSLA